MRRLLGTGRGGGGTRRKGGTGPREPAGTPGRDVDLEPPLRRRVTESLPLTFRRGLRPAKWRVCGDLGVGVAREEERGEEMRGKTLYWRMAETGYGM